MHATAGFSPTCEATDPEPVPAPETLSEYEFSVKVAVTLRACVIGTVHGPVPVHALLQPLNVDPVEAVAVSVTEVS